MASGGKTGRELKNWLSRVFKQHKPEKLSDVNDILEMYSSNPETLVNKVVKKYKLRTDRLPKHIKTLYKNGKKGNPSPSPAKSKKKKEENTIDVRRDSDARRRRNRQKISMPDMDLPTTVGKDMNEMNRDELIQECTRLRGLTKALRSQLEDIQRLTSMALDQVTVAQLGDPAENDDEEIIEPKVVGGNIGGALIQFDDFPGVGYETDSDNDDKQSMQNRSLRDLLVNDMDSLQKINSMKEELHEGLSYAGLKDYFGGSSDTPLGTALPRVFEILQDPIPSDTGEAKITEQSFRAASQMFGVDPDADNAVEKLVEVIHSINPAEKIAEQLHEFDNDIDGQICIYEMPSLLESFNVTKSPQQLYDVFKWLDVDGSFKISTDEFQEFVWDEWKRLADKNTSDCDIDNVSDFMSDALDRALEEAEQPEKTNVTEDMAKEALELIELQGANLETFVSVVQSQKLRSPQYKDSGIADIHIYQFIEPFTHESIYRCANLLQVSAEEYGEEDDWYVDFMQELVDAIYEVYMNTDKLLGVFAVGESMTFSHFKTLCQFLKVDYCNTEEEMLNRFSKLDKDNSEHIDFHELGPKCLQVAKENSTTEPVAILQHVLSFEKLVQFFE